MHASLAGSAKADLEGFQNLLRLRARQAFQMSHHHRDNSRCSDSTSAQSRIPFYLPRRHWAIRYGLLPSPGPATIPATWGGPW